MLPWDPLWRLRHVGYPVSPRGYRGLPAFASLSMAGSVRAYEKQGGGRWLRELIHYILEALLSDPVYGGNPGGIGWRWLEHRPGYKRPSPQQRYFLLADR